MNKLLKAWTVAGSHPEYHFKKIAELKETWPQLYEGIVEALKYQELKEASIAEAKNEERERIVNLAIKAKNRYEGLLASDALPGLLAFLKGKIMSLDDLLISIKDKPK